MAHLDAIERVIEYEENIYAVEKMAIPNPLTDIARIIIAESPTAVRLLRSETFAELVDSQDIRIRTALTNNQAAQKRIESAKGSQRTERKI